TPMVFNTAFSFFLCGVGIIAHVFRSRLIPQICGISVLILAALTLIQYVFKVELGIDRLIIEPYISVRNPFPGRMAPNTSMGFIISGAAIFLLGVNAKVNLKKALIGFVGALATALGLTVIVGYFFEFDSIYGWGDYVRMAPTTAAAFAFCGISFFCLSIAGEKNQKSPVPRWLPLPIGVSVAMIALIMWQALASNESKKLKSELKDEANNISRLFSESLTNQVNGLSRMARRWEVSGGVAQEVWLNDANWYIKHRKGTVAIYLLNRDLTLKWAASAKNQKKTARQEALGKEILQSEYISNDLNTNPIILPQSELIQGGSGMVVSVPFYNTGKFDGVFQSEHEINSYLDPILKFFDEVHINIDLKSESSDDHLRYGEMVPDSQNQAVGAAESKMSGLTWRISTWAKPELLEQYITLLPELSLLIGLVSALLVSLLIHYYLKTKSKSLEMAELNQSLERQVAERTKKLTRRDEFTRGWLSNCTDGAWDWDLEKNTVFMTSQFKELLGYNEDEISDSVDIWRKLVPPMDLQVADKAYQEYINNGQRYAYQLRWIHKNGSMVWTLCRGEGIKDETGKIVRMVGTLTDISKHKKLEEELIHWAEQLERKNSDLERFNRLAVGREKRMIELKVKINELCRELGKPETYSLGFAKEKRPESKSVIG
ncbi:MAG TPA: PAS domain-containing protein, partial [candidate division Zixibacteria bacterium]|nr:PAS domain-containing protein [candidate division Zixibacteria bacterium]